MGLVTSSPTGSSSCSRQYSPSVRVRQPGAEQVRIIGMKASFHVTRQTLATRAKSTLSRR
jgi:hypothetical protein